MTRRVNAETLALIQQWEGLRLEAYQDVGGVWTIGYGHTKTAKPGMKISKGQATALLRQDLADAEAAVSSLTTVELSDNQYGALVSLVYNIGAGAFQRSTLLRKLNAGDYAAVPGELARWNKVNGKPVEGLSNRRAAEAGLWVRGPNKPLSQSRTIAGAAASSVGLVGGAAQDAGYSLQSLTDYSEYIKIACALLLLAGIGLTVWARVDDARKGRR